MAVALAVRRILAPGTDAPAGIDWMVDGVGLFGRWLELDQGEFRPFTWLLRETNAGDWLWKLGWLAANGQWDPRIALLAGVVPAALALRFLLGWLLAEVGTGGGAFILLFATLLTTLPATSAAASSPQAALWAFVALGGLIHVRTLTSASTGCRQILGWSAGAAAVLLSTAGVASAVASMVWAGLRIAQGESLKRQGANLLGGAGFVLFAALRSLTDRQGDLDFGAAAYGSWLQTSGLRAAFMAGLLLWVAYHCWKRIPDRGGCTALITWVLVIATIVPDSAWLGSLMAIIALCGIVHLHRLSEGRDRLNVLVSGLWILGILHGALGLGRELPSLEALVGEGSLRGEATRLFVATGEVRHLETGLDLPVEAQAQVANVLSDQRMARWLPASVRHPLAVQWEASSLSRAAPALPGISVGQSVAGTWKAENPGALVGQWESGPQATSFALLQFQVAGRLIPGVTSLHLLGQNGETLTPLQTSLDATEIWRRVNVPTRRGAFRILLEDQSSLEWLATTAPIELSRGTWMASKVVVVWPWLMAAGLVCYVIGCTGVIGSWIQEQNGAKGVAPDGTRLMLRQLAWLAVAIYGVWLLPYIDTIAAGADSSGYLNQARLFRDGALTEAAVPIAAEGINPWIYTPLGYLYGGENRLVPIYPTGLSVMVMTAAKVMPLKTATALIIWIHLVGGVILTQRFARQCALPEGWTWLAAGGVALNPVYIYSSLQPMSDGPSLVWLTAALYAAIRGRDCFRWALAAGLATAVAVLLRPANAIAFVPLLVLLGSIRPVVGWIVGALPGAVWQLWHAWQVFGHPLATGYGDAWGAFEAKWIAPTVVHYAIQLTLTFSPLIAFVVVAPWAHEVNFRIRAALLGCVGAYFGFYAAYYCTHETWWYLRFVLPSYPALIILTLIGIRHQLLRRRLDLFATGFGVRGRAGSLAAVALAATFATINLTRLPALESARHHQVYADVAAWLAQNVPSGTPVFAFQASGAIVHHTRLGVLRFDLVPSADSKRAAAALLASGRPVYAALFPYDRMMAGDRLPKGNWRLVAQIREVEILRLESLLMDLTEP